MSLLESIFKSKSLKDLLLVHELIFIVLILLALAAGGFGIHLRDQSFQESQRINFLIQEIQQTRGDLYRQMKELFDAFLLDDQYAQQEYQDYTISIDGHFDKLKKLASDQNELTAITDLHKSYHTLILEAPTLFRRYQEAPNQTSKKSLYQDMETGIFNSYEQVSKRTEQLLAIKQTELEKRLKESKLHSNFLFYIPLILAGLLLFFSRSFLNFGIVRPINRILKATNEISSGKLENQVPLSGSAELVQLSSAINKMAVDLKTSQDALIRSEKQAALGLLVPMLAHNIRNPLASIRATAQVANDPDLDKETQESFKGIIITVDRLERWIVSLLAYLHPIKPQMSHVPLQGILQNTLIALTPKILEKEIHIKQTKTSLSDSILTDEHLLEQALYNLVLNAIEAAPKSSTIKLDVRNSDQNMLEILITDQGGGIPFTPNPHSASPGPTTKRFGTGLGIPFAFKVCEELGGTIEFTKAPQGGTQVTLRLPQ